MRERLSFDLNRAQGLLESGLSLRAVASSLGISDRTLRRRLQDGERVCVNGDADLDEEALLLQSIAELQERLKEKRKRVLEEWQAFGLNEFRSLEPSEAVRSSFSDSVLNLRRRFFERIQLSPALDSALTEYENFEQRVLQLAFNLQASKKALDQPQDAHFSSILTNLLAMLKPVAEETLQCLLSAVNAEELIVAREIASEFKAEFDKFVSDPLSGIWCELARVSSVIEGAGQSREWRRDLATAYLIRGRLDDPLTCLRLINESDPGIMSACRSVLSGFNQGEKRIRATKSLREFMQSVEAKHFLGPLIELLQ